MAKKKQKTQLGAAPSPPAEADRAAGGPAPGGEEVPLSLSPLPLLLLNADGLGELLELCFVDKQILELCAELKLYSPGYRIEAMPPNQVAHLLAEEVLAAKDAQALVETAIRAVLRDPIFDGQAVTAEHLQGALELFSGDPLLHLARVAWRALLEEDPKLRETALLALDVGIELLDQPAQVKAPRKPPPPKDLEAARDEARRAREDSERAEKERASMKEQLGAARAEIAQREKVLGEVRDQLAQVQAELARASSDLGRLNAAGEGRALADARRLSNENRSLSEKLKSLHDEHEALRVRLAAAEERADQAQAPAPAQAPEEELVTQDEAATFLIPYFSREFYDSLARWDRRLQRAAFDKVSLLARDWRHGSLRALALGGLPDYYRIRIATDVRLIYRRGEGNTLEILSLIDREDLDRYIRQARTRPA